LFNAFEIAAKEFDTTWNRDYATTEKRANKPFYPPVTWYRHGLDVTKYGGTNATWLGDKNVPGEWPCTFHGIGVGKVNFGVGGGPQLSTTPNDPFKNESFQQNQSSQNYPGNPIYCSPDVSIIEQDGTCPEIIIPVQGGKAKYKVAFMCRVHPDFYTEHGPSSNTAKLAANGTKDWRVFDSQFIRPYGLLVKQIHPPV